MSPLVDTQPGSASHEYWTSSGLRDLFEALPAPPGSTALAPDIADLVRLHRIVRSRPCVTALELGIGYSTIVLAHAMDANEHEHGGRLRSAISRNTQLFKVFTVDANRVWLDLAVGRIPSHLRDRVHPHFSTVSATTFAGRLCHVYDELPDVIPDVIYLDGPDPKDVTGTVRGMSFGIPERTVMSADVLLMEPTLLPGTVIVVDGRENNVRFLLRNLQRPVEITREDDVSIIELTEPRLGAVDVIGVDVLGRPAERPG